MEKREIELEIRKRVEFKLNEIFSNVETDSLSDWDIAFVNNSEKKAYYISALKMLRNRLTKETKKIVPSKNMDTHLNKIKRIDATKKLVNKLIDDDDKKFKSKLVFIGKVVKELQNN